MEDRKISALEEEQSTLNNMVDSYMNRMSIIEEDFNNGILHLQNYEGVKKFKSIRRAIKRGHVSLLGDVYPKRPFKNCKAKKKSVTFMKRRLFEQSRHLNKCMN